VTRTRVLLGEALDLLIDHRGKTPKKLGGDWSSKGHRVVSAINIKDSRVDGNDHHYVADELFNKWMKEPLRAGDVLLTSEAPTGEVAYLPEDTDWCLGQRLFGLRGKAGVLEGRYLYYLLRSGDVRNQLIARSTGTTVSGIRQSELVKVELDLPPVPEQRGIAATLGALDDKIESNRRVQNLVLDIAQAAYVEACSKGAELTALKDVGRWLSGGTPSTTNSSYWGGTLPWVSAASLKTLYVRKSDRNLTLLGADAATNIVPAGTVVFVVRGMSLKSEFRFGLTQRDVAFGQDCKAIIPRICPAVLTIALRASTAAILELVDEAGHGTGRLATDLLEQLPIEIPTDPAFAPVAQSLLARGASAAEENDRLTALRDTLLPELLSGRIRVPEAKDDVA